MSTIRPNELRFGHVIVRPAQRSVLVDEEPVALGARALDVLFALVEHRDRVVTKDELLEHAWPGLVVEENNLQVQVSALRKVLGANAIATVPARGYRLTLAVDSGDDAAQPAPVPRHNLPPQLTRFVGHEEDLVLHAQQLEQTRLLTLTGIGGCGKTRLALRIAERALAVFPDGAWYVDLAPLLDADRVPLTVATALGLNEEPDTSIVDQLCRHLGKRRLLLVLDNCEHLVPACGALVQRLLEAAPRLSVLAGSREGMGVPGERLMPVRSLSFPPAGTTLTAKDAAPYEAVRLFVDRAQALDPDFAVGDENAAAVAEICRRLDGIPLALELAAARTKVLSIEEIRRRLDDRFRLLTGGSRVALGRQQTLLATIQWSHDHLGEDERRVLRRLSVFAGGWTLEAAVALAGDTNDEYAMLDVLARLTDLSLVTTTVDAGGRTRYSMLETVRQYAQERLNESGEAEATRGRHLDYCVALTQAAELGFFGPDQGSWYARIAADFENILVAHARCDNATNGAELSLRLLAAIRAHLICSGLLPLGERLLSAALERPAAQAGTRARCGALLASCQLLQHMGRYGESRARAQEGLSIATVLGDPGEQSRALLVLGNCEAALDRIDAANSAYERSLALARSLGDPFRIGRAIEGMAVLARAKGDLDQATVFYEDGLAINRRLGDTKAVMYFLMNLATMTIGRRQAGRAREYLLQAIDLGEQLGLELPQLGQVLCAAGLAALECEWERTARLRGAMEAGAERLSAQLDPWDVRLLGPLITEAKGALGESAHSAAAEAGRALSVREALTEVRQWLRS